MMLRKPRRDDYDISVRNDHPGKTCDEAEHEVCPCGQVHHAMSTGADLSKHETWWGHGMLSAARRTDLRRKHGPNCYGCAVFAEEG